MRIIDCEQGSPEWFAARLGIPSASGLSRIIRPDGQASTSAQNYRFELLAERLAGKRLDEFDTPWLQRGRELEDSARTYYKLRTPLPVTEVGFCLHETLDVGCSPDALVGEDGGLEIKCPKGSTHVKYLLADKLPNEYYVQVQSSLWITGRRWWTFLSYHPDLPPFEIIVKPDPVFMQTLENRVKRFLTLLKSMEMKLERRGIRCISK